MTRQQERAQIRARVWLTYQVGPGPAPHPEYPWMWRRCHRRHFAGEKATKQWRLLVANRTLAMCGISLEDAATTMATLTNLWPAMTSFQRHAIAKSLINEHMGALREPIDGRGLAQLVADVRRPMDQGAALAKTVATFKEDFVGALTRDLRKIGALLVDFVAMDVGERATPASDFTVIVLGALLVILTVATLGAGLQFLFT